MDKNESRRFLRSNRDRNLLYWSQDGLCAICGDELRGGWHAHHIEPFAITHRTNVHEMQALCERCHEGLHKGIKENEMRIPGDESSLVNMDSARSGIIESRRLLIESVENGKQYISIVLPTRYGKSDVVRLSAYELCHLRIISAAVVVSPYVNLRDQIISMQKMEKTAERYQFTRGFPCRALKRMTNNFTVNGEMLVSVTMSLIHQNLTSFCDWIRSIKHRTGLPVLMFWDECQMESDKNEWGKVVHACTEAGAISVSLTATPYRNNNEKIAGFDYETIEEYDEERRYNIKIGETDDKDIYKTSIYNEKHSLYVIKPDLYVTFQRAWTEEKPPCLCSINRIGVDVSLKNLGDIRLDEEDPDVEMLSQLNESDTKSSLWKIVREPFLIRAVSRKFVESLRDRQKQNALIRGIIFTTNDNQSDASANKHAKQCERILREVDPSLRILILTMKSEEDASAKLNVFLDDDRITDDILIVKQMGNVGLDCKWLKVGADLSSTRSDNTYIQRMMRIATISVEDRLLVCDWITPDDVLGKSCFERLVSDQGGAYDQVTLRELIDEITTEKDKHESGVRKLYMPLGAELSDFEDNLGNWKDREHALTVSWMRSRFTGISSDVTDPQIIKTFSEFPGVLAAFQKQFSFQSTSSYSNTLEKITDLKSSILVCAERAASIQNKPYTQEGYKQSISEFFITIYKRCGIARGIRLSDIDDISRLERLKTEAYTHEDEIKKGFYRSK